MARAAINGTDNPPSSGAASDGSPNMGRAVAAVRRASNGEVGTAVTQRKRRDSTERRGSQDVTTTKDERDRLLLHRCRHAPSLLLDRADELGTETELRERGHPQEVRTFLLR